MEFDSIGCLYVDKRAEHRLGGLGGQGSEVWGSPAAAQL